MLTKRPASRFEEVRKWIAGGRASRIDPQSDLDRHLSSRHVGTCQWIFEAPSFTKWQSCDEGASLWVNAAPGSGKSVLCASVVEQMMQTNSKVPCNVIYFFCRFDDPREMPSNIGLEIYRITSTKADQVYTG